MPSSTPMEAALRLDPWRAPLVAARQTHTHTPAHRSPEPEAETTARRAGSIAAAAAASAPMTDPSPHAAGGAAHALARPPSSAMLLPPVKTNTVAAAEEETNSNPSPVQATATAAGACAHASPGRVPAALLTRGLGHALPPQALSPHASLAPLRLRSNAGSGDGAGFALGMGPALSPRHGASPPATATPTAGMSPGGHARSQTLSPLVLTRKQMTPMTLPPSNAASAVTTTSRAQETAVSNSAPSASRSLVSHPPAAPHASSSALILPHILGNAGSAPILSSRSTAGLGWRSSLDNARDERDGGIHSAQTVSSLGSSTTASPMQFGRSAAFSAFVSSSESSPSVGVDVRGISKLRRIVVLPQSPPPPSIVSPSAGPGVAPSPSPSSSPSTTASPSLHANSPATAPLTPEIMVRFGPLLRFFQSPHCRLFSLCAWSISIFQRDLATMCKGHSSSLPILRTLEALNAADRKFEDMASLIRALQRTLKKQSARQLIGNGGAQDQVFEDPSLLDARPFSSPLIREWNATPRRAPIGGLHRPSQCTPPTDEELEQLLDVCGGSLARVSQAFVFFLLEETPPRNAFRSVGELIHATRLLLSRQDLGTIGLGMDECDPERLDDEDSGSATDDSHLFESHDNSCNHLAHEDYSLLQGLPALTARVPPLRLPLPTNPHAHDSASHTHATTTAACTCAQPLRVSRVELTHAPAPAAAAPSDSALQLVADPLDQMIQCR